MKYINQLDYPYILYQTNTDHPEDAARSRGTFRMSGCGLASAIMVADRLLTDYKFDLFDAVELSYTTGANHIIGTDYTIFAPAFAEKFGLEYVATADTETVLECLRTGGCVVALSAGDREGHVGLFTHGAHYITLISQLRDGRVVVLDPALTETKFDEEGRKGKVQVDGHLVYAHIEDIAADFDAEKLRALSGIDNVKPFACFWKKL